MRLHSLEMTAFGPFCGTEHVSFDDVTESGLFLLCGPTGSGKTSVLDAVCFALYGEVPGDRNTAKRLRSDHAPPEVAPVVALEVTINGRRFRLRRSPSWQRPKRRGHGTTTEPAKVTIEERTQDGWRTLSTRVDETQHLVTESLGMTLTQFCQVAMLPQGRFQAFLRAKSDERHKVLQQLFRTSAFEGVERWLVGRRQLLRQASQARQDAVASVVSRLSEASDAAVPMDWDLSDLARPAQDGEVLGWAEALLASSAARRRDLATRCQAAAEQLSLSRTRVESARDLQALRDRFAKAEAMQQELVGSADAALRMRGELDAAREAVVVVPLIGIAERATAAATEAHLAAAEVLREAVPLLADKQAAGGGEPTLAELERAEREARGRLAVAEAMLPREAELELARAAEREFAVRQGDVDAESCRLRERCAALPQDLTQLRGELDERTRAAWGRSSSDETCRRLTVQLEAAELLPRLLAELVEARADHQASIETATSLRERWEEVREARVTGMAAELAVALGGGQPCPVCGSAEHPAVARRVEGAPTKKDEDQARKHFEHADFAAHAHADRVRALEHTVTTARAVCDDLDEGELRAWLATAERAGADARRAEADVRRVTTKLATVEGELADVRSRFVAAEAERATVHQQLAQARVSVGKLTSEITTLLQADDLASVAQLVESSAHAASVFARAASAVSKRETAAASAADAVAEADSCAGSRGFPNADTALSAVRSGEQIAALEHTLVDRELRCAEVRAVTSDPTVLAAMGVPPPDVTGLEQLTSQAESAATAAAAEADRADRQQMRLTVLAEELSAELDGWTPTMAEHAVACRMSTLAEGKSADNAWHMRLSAYVLAVRLQQVVAAANERLRSMSDERYSLEHSAVRGVGELRGGLSLLVRDEWTGESRDPATLSGGETFVASLALALGLADVVTAEAGGPSVDTLFIDEGFGSLDPETLDDVMDTLDGLRNGGRVVGIVSHVPQMSNRVPAQLQLRKQRCGSTVVAVREPG